MSLTSRRVLASGLLALAFAGCSFKVVMPPPQPSEWPPTPTHGAPEARCTSSVFPPAADTTAALVLDSVAVIERNGPRITPIIFAAASIPAIASAIYGYVVTAECRRYLRLFNQ
jgi:hypothetical protein